ncbi:MAG: LysM peptidoglycan-binding domain-containing protein [Herbinix sp.]|nr:LysM peptidoglycan-binding domain-containing protein [Herbinix sp.]
MYCINYVINEGDTLYSISRHFNVSLNAIMDSNPMVNVYNLIIGQTINIPVSVPQNNYTHYTTYLVTKEDTLGNILDENSINLADLLEFNSLNDVYLLPGTTLKIPIVGEGESGVSL